MANYFFQQHVDHRSRRAMTSLLNNHCRYDTMRSWNAATSYAHTIKIYRLGLHNNS